MVRHRSFLAFDSVFTAWRLGSPVRRAGMRMGSRGPRTVVGTRLSVGRRLLTERRELCVSFVGGGRAERTTAFAMHRVRRLRRT